MINLKHIVHTDIEGSQKVTNTDGGEEDQQKNLQKEMGASAKK